jgi:cytochrome c-type biogenesis protein CcmF
MGSMVSSFTASLNASLGHVAVLCGLVCAVFGSVLGFAAGRTGQLRALQWTKRAAYAYAASFLVANLIMVKALLTHDFSVSYVTQVGSRATPALYAVVSLWSSLEGSILFWGLILGAYIAAFALWHGHRDPRAIAYGLAVQLFVAAFFALLVASAANPFVPVSPVPLDGPGPNALLQNHILMVIHPPMLYLGYVGMTIPFGIAIAALLRGELTDGWLKVLRRWTLVPWLFLSVGIILGSWWAYEVLGWGGYWAWDPVENASFLPWLAATGYLHSTVVQERRRILKAWTLSLVLASFMLTILGTFMTRSGVFNSVHSFTQSAIGPLFLVFLAVILVASLGLLASRAHLLENEGHIDALWSRETAFLGNNILFVVFTFTVLLGTVFPLVTEAVRNVKVSVGEPYFNRMAVPMGLMMVFLMGVGPVLPWGRPNLSAVLKDFAWPALVGICVTCSALLAGLRGGLPLLTFGLCGFAAYVTVRELVMPAWQRHRSLQQAFLTTLWRSSMAQRRRTGGYLVHLAMIVIVAAIAGSQNYRVSVEASLQANESMQLGDYSFTFLQAEEVREPQRDAVVARVRVTRAGKTLGNMVPRLNFYPSMREPVGTPHVVTLGSTDLYLSLLAVEQGGRRVGLKAYSIPMVAWIWRSLPLLVLGSMISMWPRGRRSLRRPEDAASPPAAVPIATLTTP